MTDSTETARARLLAQEIGLPSENAEICDSTDTLHHSCWLDVTLGYPNGELSQHRVPVPAGIPVSDLNSCLHNAAIDSGAVAGYAEGATHPDGNPLTLVFGIDAETVRDFIAQQELLADAEVDA